MPTVRQRKLAKNLVKALDEKNAPLESELVVLSGYSEASAEHPGKLIRQEGVKQALQDLGFTVEGADSVVAEILYSGQEHNRLKAADMIYDRLGAKAPAKTVNVNLEVDASSHDPELQALRDEYERKLEAKLRGETI